MIEVIAAALAAGAVAGLTDTAKQAIGDAYAGLKSKLVARFGKAASAATALEDDPKDADAQKLLAKRLDETGAAADPEVQAEVAKLTAALQAAGITLSATGTGNVQVAGNNNTTTSNVSTDNSGVNVQGSTVHGDVVQGDKVGGNKIDKQINTGGGAYIGGNVSAGGDFVGRDKITYNVSTAPELSAIVSPDARALVPLLNQYFSISDIDSLCFEMGIDEEQLRGQTKDEKARSLAHYVDQRGRLDELKRLMRVARPNLRDRLA